MLASSVLNAGVPAISASALALRAFTHSSDFSPLTSSSQAWGSSPEAVCADAPPAMARPAIRQALDNWDMARSGGTVNPKR